MAGKKLNLDDFKKTNCELTLEQLNKLKGGYKYVPSGSGSIGFINWDGVDIRGNNIGNGIGPVADRSELSKGTFLRRK